MSNFWKQAVAEHDHTVVLSLLAAGLRLDDARDVAQETWLRLMEAHAGGRLPRVELPGLAIRQAGFLVSDRARAGRLRVQVARAKSARRVSLRLRAARSLRRRSRPKW